jgi:hypothetical protein
MSKEHTPLPYEILHRQIICTPKTPVAVAFVNKATDAVFVNRACNNHYQLVEALEGMIDSFKPETDRQTDAYNDAVELLKTLNQ